MLHGCSKKISGNEWGWNMLQLILQHHTMCSVWWLQKLTSIKCCQGYVLFSFFACYRTPVRTNLNVQMQLTVWHHNGPGHACEDRRKQTARPLKTDELQPSSSCSSTKYHLKKRRKKKRTHEMEARWKPQTTRNKS